MKKLGEIQKAVGTPGWENNLGGLSGEDEPRRMSFKKGGVVPKTGMAKVHKGERVLTKKQARKYSGKKG